MQEETESRECAPSGYLQTASPAEQRGPCSGAGLVKWIFLFGLSCPAHEVTTASPTHTAPRGNHRQEHSRLATTPSQEVQSRRQLAGPPQTCSTPPPAAQAGRQAATRTLCGQLRLITPLYGGPRLHARLYLWLWDAFRIQSSRAAPTKSLILCPGLCTVRPTGLPSTQCTFHALARAFLGGGQSLHASHLANLILGPSEEQLLGEAALRPSRGTSHCNSPTALSQGQVAAPL